MSVVGFTLTSAATQVAAPFSIGHAFKQGDVPAGQSLAAAGASTFQVTPRNTWPDGSLKFAQLAGTVDLTANVPAAVTLSLGTSAAGTALTTADLKATGAVASIDCGTFGSVSWATTDWDSPFQTWVTGPVMSSWVYRKPVGSDPHLVAWLEVRLYAGGQVEVLPWVENGYLLVSGPINKSATYAFTLGGTQRFSLAIDLPHHCRTVLIGDEKLSYWLGTNPGIVPQHDKTYLASTELVPKYRGNLASDNTEVAALPATYTPMGKGSFLYDKGFGNMAASGYQPAIGLLPTHDVHYLTYSYSNLYATVVRNGYFAGQFGIHYRDETTNRPIKFSSYPTLVIRSGSGMKDSGSGGTSTYTPVVSGTAPTYWDTAHCPSVGFLAYLLTGSYYLMEEVQFAATAIHLNVEDASRAGKVYASGYSGPQTVLSGPYTGASGICSTEVQTRSSAWHFRSLTQALCVTPDSDVLQAEFKTAVEHNCSWFHGVYSAGPSNPFGFIQSTWVDVNFGTARGLPPWQQDFVTAAWGYAKAMGLPISSTAKSQMDSFFTWKAQSIVGRLSATNSDWWYVNSAPYALACTTTVANNYFSALGATGPWFPSWKAMYDATYATPPSWLSNTDGVLASEFFPETQPGQFHNLFPALSYAVRFGVAGAKSAYDRITGASNYSSITSVMDTRPVWSVVPTSIPAAAPSMGKTLRIDTTDFYPGLLTIGDTGHGVLGATMRANTATGGSGPGAFYNDYDGVDDDNREIRGELLSLPTAGNLFWNEDGSFSFTGAPDGAYSFTYRLLVDEVDMGTATVSLLVNVAAAGASMAISTDDAVFSGSARGGTFATLNITTDDAVFSGSVVGGSTQATASLSITTDDAVFSGTATVALDLSYPNPADVREGVHYGPGGTMVGTMTGGLANPDQVAAAVWGRIIENTMTAEELLRILIAQAVGNASGLGTSTLSFKSLDGSKVRIEGTIQNGQRTVNVVDTE